MVRCEKKSSFWVKIVVIFLTCTAFNKSHFGLSLIYSVDRQWRLESIHTLLLSRSIPLDLSRSIPFWVDPYPFEKKGVDRLKTSLTVHTVITDLPQIFLKCQFHFWQMLISHHLGLFQISSTIVLWQLLDLHFSCQSCLKLVQWLDCLQRPNKSLRQFELEHLGLHRGIVVSKLEWSRGSYTLKLLLYVPDIG